MISIYLMKQVNKWQPVGLPTSTSGFGKLYAKVKMAPETCQMVKKHYDKSNGNFWDIYGYVKMYVCMIYMYLTKQVNRLKLVGLPTKTSDLAKLYTMDKIGTESCQMVKKRNPKFHNRFWNAYSYLKGRIMEFGKYLRTVIPGRRSQKPPCNPPCDGVYKEVGNRRMPEWFRSFSPHAPRTSCLGSLVARYHRPFESRPVNSTRRETYQQLAACSSPPYSGWFAPLSIPPGSPAALGPVTEPLGGKRPSVAQKPHRRKH